MAVNMMLNAPRAGGKQCATGWLRMRILNDINLRRSHYSLHFLAAQFMSNRCLTGFALRAIVPLVAALALAGCHFNQQWHLANVTNIVAPLQFSMDSTTGKVETAKDLRGKIVMMYFGYTNCPDVCPTTLAELAGVIRKLGTKANDVRVLFVTVDPKRDTIPVLKSYVAAFDKTHFIGLRGTPKQIEDMAKRYRVGYSYEKPDPDGSYVVNHSSGVFIFGPDGKARLLGTSLDTSSEYEADLKRLIRES